MSSYILLDLNIYQIIKSIDLISLDYSCKCTKSSSGKHYGIPIFANKITVLHAAKSVLPDNDDFIIGNISTGASTFSRMWSRGQDSSGIT
jgi:hypothetical protein